jgi:hypothetical protein
VQQEGSSRRHSAAFRAVVRRGDIKFPTTRNEPYLPNRDGAKTFVREHLKLQGVKTCLREVRLRSLETRHFTKGG